MSNPTLVDGYKWHRAPEKFFSTPSCAGTSVTTVQGQKLYRNKSKQFWVMFTFQHISFAMKKKKKRSESGSGKDVGRKTVNVKEWETCSWKRWNRDFILSVFRYTVCSLSSEIHHSYKCQLWLRFVLSHGSSLPHPSGVFIWKHAINPELSERPGWAWFWCRRSVLLQW